MSLSQLTALVLAGGFGTRLSHVVSDVPKPMAPVGERPFLDYVLDHLQHQGIKQVVLCTGHLGHLVRAHYGDVYEEMSIHYSHEETPLGTGGAIRHAMSTYDLEEALVLNGDTYLPMDYSHLHYFHRQWSAPITMAVREMTDFDRYGAVTFDAWNRVRAFHEKQSTDHGWINAGTYIIRAEALCDEQSFSLEKSVLEPMSEAGRLFALPSPAYFIDIGVPEDYTLFCRIATHKELPTGEHRLLDSALFLDRDGVINERIPGDYVKKRAEFVLIDGAVEAIALMQPGFDRTFVVTNQQGIGKGLMTRPDLDDVHAYFASLAQAHGVRFDEIFAAEGLAHDDPPMRKPKVAMAQAAAAKYGPMSFVRSVMIGDSTTDIEFGIRMGMYTILVGAKSDSQLAHHRCEDLSEAAQHLSTRSTR